MWVGTSQKVITPAAFLEMHCRLSKNTKKQSAKEIRCLATKLALPIVSQPAGYMSRIASVFLL
jgi:hypothetical protein